MRVRITALMYILFLLVSAGVGYAQAPDIAALDEGGYRITARAYHARIGVDGNLRSLLVNGNEFLHPESGASFFTERPITLAVSKQEGLQITAETEQYSIVYTFDAKSVTMALTHPNEKGAAFVIGLSDKIAYVQDIASRLMAAVPVDYQWGNVKAYLPTGEFLEMRGGTRIWGITGNPAPRQVWESSNLLPKKEYTLQLIPGVGAPPTPTLAQLSNLRVTLEKGNYIIPAQSPAVIQAIFENNSNERITSELLVSVTSSSGKQILQERRALSCAAHETEVLRITTHPNEADFYQVSCAVMINENQRSAGTVFGYAITDISLPLVLPDDFSTFWERVLVEASEPAVLRLWPMPSQPSMPNVLIYEAWVEVDGQRLFSGWLSAPKYRGRYPGLLVLPPERVNTLGPNPALANLGFIVFTVLPTGESVQRRFEPIISWGTQGLEDDATFRMRTVMIRYLQAITALSALTLSAPDDAVSIDPQRIGVTGIGLGGGLALALAALDERIQAVAPDVPYYCHIETGMLQANSREISAKWPYPEIANYLRTHPDIEDREAVVQQLRYFDVSNFAPQVSCPVFMSIGMTDSYALPTNTIAMYNRLPGPKSINIYLAGHEGGGVAHWDAKMRWLRQVLGGRSPEVHQLPVEAPKVPLIDDNPLPLPDIPPGGDDVVPDPIDETDRGEVPEPSLEEGNELQPPVEDEGL